MSSVTGGIFTPNSISCHDLRSSSDLVSHLSFASMEFMTNSRRFLVRSDHFLSVMSG